MVALANEGDRRLPRTAPSPQGEPPGRPASSRDSGTSPGPGRGPRRTQIRRFLRAVEANDEATVREALVRLSRRRPWLAPVALAAGAVVMLFEGLTLLFHHWRLAVVQVLPAMWIWLAMLDLKVHVLHGRSLSALRGPVTIPLVLAVAAVTAAAFFLNAVFAFAISAPDQPLIRPAFRQARRHLVPITAWGGAVGIWLGVSTVIVTRWGLWWFAVSLSSVIAVMMVCSVLLPSRLIGGKRARSRQDKLVAAVVGGTIGAVVCAPPYLLGRFGLLLLGSHTLFLAGILMLVAGLVLQAATTSAVKTIKMSAALGPSHPQDAG